MSEHRPVPGYEGRYELDREGNIYGLIDSHGNRREEPKLLKYRRPARNTKQLYVQLHDGYGDTLYANAAVLMAEAFGLGKVEDANQIIFLDGDCTNVALDNLRVGPDEGEKAERRPIPGFEGRYEIDREGTVWSLVGRNSCLRGEPKVRKTRKPTPNQRDKSVKLTAAGHTRTFNVAALMARVWVTGREIDAAYVGFRDGNRDNLRPENLFIMTEEGVRADRILQRGKRTAVVRIKPDGSKTYYHSMKDAAEDNYICEASLTKLLNGLPSKTFVDGTIFREATISERRMGDEMLQRLCSPAD